MKLHAKLLLRPKETKDSFDVYAYVAAHGAEAVAASLQSSGERDKVVAGLRALFADVGSPGVRDVVAYASTLETQDRELLARAVVDLFDELLARLAPGG